VPTGTVSIRLMVRDLDSAFAEAAVRYRKNMCEAGRLIG